MKHLILTLAAASILTGCLGNKDVPYRVDLRTQFLLLPPVKTDTPLTKDTLGRYCRSEAYAVTKGKTRYASEIDDIQPLISPGNIFPGGKLATDEVSSLALSVDCGSVGIIRLLERQTLPPQRAVLHITWLRAMDSNPYVNKTMDVSMEFPETREDFNEFVRKQSNIKTTVDEWLDKDEKFLASTGSLSPQMFNRYLAHVAIRALLDDQSKLFVAENQAYAAEEALIARQEAEEAEEAARLKRINDAQTALAALDRQRRAIQLEFEAERKRLELDTLKKKKAAIAAARLLEKDRELYIQQESDAADHEQTVALNAAQTDQDSKLAQLNLTVASYASKFYHSGKLLYSEGRLVEALEDLNRSLTLVPDFDWAVYLSAIIYYERKDYDKAIPLLQKMITSATPALVPYARLRLYLCEMLANGESKALVDASVNKYHWPGPVLAMYQGKLTPEGCLKEAKHHKVSLNASRTCSAHYYIAEYHVTRGESYDAIRHLKKAVKFKTDWMELLFAKSRLGQYTPAANIDQKK